MAAAGLPIAFLTPPTWKRLIGIPTGRERAKDAARGAELLDFVHADRRWTVTVGRFSDGRIAEIFLDTPKASALREIAADVAIVASIALQCGAPLASLPRPQ